MQKIIIILFFLILPFRVFAADYDAFILNFLRVKPIENTLYIDMSLGSPKTVSLEKTLKEGQILKFSIEMELIRERLLRNKSILRYTKDYYLQYEPLSRQFMVQESDDSNNVEYNSHKNSTNWNIILRNTDSQYLLETLVNNLHFQIPINLDHNKPYIMQIRTNIKQVIAKNWAQKNLFFLESDIIQPAQFEYEFIY